MREIGVKMASTDEQETTVVGSPSKSQPEWMIWSNVKRDITRFRKKLESEGNGPVRIIASGFDEDGTEWVDIRIPWDKYSPVTGIKRVRELSDTQRAELRDRLMKARSGA